MSIRTLLLVLHVLGAVVALGFSLSYGPWIRRGEAHGPSERAFALRTVSWIDRRITTPAYVAQLVTGLLLVATNADVDGTARVQTVRREQNERLYLLLEEFEKLTGVPVLLNTSFNIKGEPIVEAPADAVNCFLSTGIDYLATMMMRKKASKAERRPWMFVSLTGNLGMLFFFKYYN